MFLRLALPVVMLVCSCEKPELLRDETGLTPSRPSTSVQLVSHETELSLDIPLSPRLPDGREVLRWVHPLAGKRLLPGHSSQIFGAARPGRRPFECGRGHCGVDIGRLRGSVVHAAARGKVARVHRADDGRAGRYVVLAHPGGLETTYVHLDHIQISIEPGTTVEAGTPIGTLGRTGIVHSAAHLHFALARVGKGGRRYLDPLPLLRAATLLETDAPLDLVRDPWRLPVGTPLPELATQPVAAAIAQPTDRPPAAQGNVVLAGQVRDHNGERVAGVEVRAGEARTTTDGLGRFRFQKLEHGTIELSAEKGESWGELVVGTSPGDEIVTLQINLD